MATVNTERTPIKEAYDIVYGGGLPVTLKEIDVLKVRTGTDTFPDGITNSFIIAHIEPTIVFDAGYEMTGRYLLSAESKELDVQSIEKIVDYVKNGMFYFGIEYDNNDDMPYDNWTIKAYNEEVLREIEQVSDDLIEEGEKLFEVGDRFGFGYDVSCEDVAYGLERGLKEEQIPHAKTGFTKEFTQDFHKALRQAICDFLLAASKS